MEEKKIYRISAVDASLVAAFERLIPQLSATLNPPTAERLEQLVAAPQTVLLAAEIGGRVVGLLSLVWYDVPSGRKAWIEDVVVDAACRGGGVGAALVGRALQEARAVGADCVMLTSNPSRQAAHALYRKAGFERYGTDLFRLYLR